MKLIGLDYGLRRIGMAATDETGEFIHGLPTVDRNNFGGVDDCLKAISDVIRREDPERIVIGLPFDMQDNETAMSIEIRKFARRLSEAVSKPVDYVDESLTSRRAHDIIRMRKKKHRRAKENVDRIAACLILEAFLQEKRGV
jgi:putative Holliday junction resolvase